MLGNQDMVFNLIEAGKRVTISFWIKILGLTDLSQTQLLQFGDLKLNINLKTNILTLDLFNSQFNNLNLSTISNIVQYFGNYVFMSIAYSRKDGMHPALLSFNFNYNNSNLDYFNTDEKNLSERKSNLSNLNLTNKITISRYFMGVIAKLYLYNDFIIGTNGFITNSYSAIISPKLEPMVKLVDETSSTCVQLDMYNNNMSPPVDVVCYNDYDPVLDSFNYASKVNEMWGISRPGYMGTNNCNIKSFITIFT